MTHKKILPTFTYTDKETAFIMKLFKNTNIKIASCITNTIGNHLNPQQQQNTDDYNK
jgi:hypothetical protein